MTPFILTCFSMISRIDACLCNNTTDTDYYFSFLQAEDTIAEYSPRPEYSVQINTRKGVADSPL